jgi:hypothetical protein
MHAFWRFAPVLTCAVGALLIGGATPGGAAAGHTARLDIDACPGLAGQPQARRDLITEYLRIPSLAHPPGTPAVLDQTNFIRIRQRNADPHRVDAVLVQAIPNGASSITEMGTQIVEMAARKGKNFEVWGVERREKNLEDLVGMRRAFTQRDPSVALRYYYGNSYLDASGMFAGTFGALGATFVPLTQADVPFLADWDATVMFRDVESMLDLVPANRRHTNVFAYSAAPGGGFLSQLAGVRLHDGKRGYEELAGLIVIEGQLSRASIGKDAAPTAADVDKYIAAVQSVRNGTTPRFLDVSGSALSPGPTVQVAGSIATMSAALQPMKESIFPIPHGAAGGPLADAFNAKLRLTNRARLAYTVADDPIPGSLTGTWLLSWFGGRMGRLDFNPVGETPVCAAPGPFGLKPPCVPDVREIDPARVYGWLNGGPGGAGMIGSPMEGWTKNPKGDFDGSSVRGGLDPTSIVTVAESFGRPSTRTNLVPLAIDFPTGRRTIDASFGYGFGWYPSNRYHSVDIPFLDRFRKVLVDRPDLGIRLDFDKTAVDIPVIEYTVHADTTNPFNGKDFTAVEPGGIAIETPLAQKRSPIDPRTMLRLYNNVDIHTADNSKGALVATGKIAPGDVGAQPIPDTVVDWILARAGKTPIDLSPLPSTHVSCGS